MPDFTNPFPKFLAFSSKAAKFISDAQDPGWDRIAADLGEDGFRVVPVAEAMLKSWRTLICREFLRRHRQSDPKVLRFYEIALRRARGEILLPDYSWATDKDYSVKDAATLNGLPINRIQQWLHRGLVETEHSPGRGADRRLSFVEVLDIGFVSDFSSQFDLPTASVIAKACSVELLKHLDLITSETASKYKATESAAEVLAR